MRRGPVQNRYFGPSFALNQYLQRETMSRQKGNLETDLVVKFIGNSSVRKRTEVLCGIGWGNEDFEDTELVIYF